MWSSGSTDISKALTGLWQSISSWTRAARGCKIPVFRTAWSTNVLSSIQRIVNRFWHSKRCVQVQFENYEKSKATKSRLNTKRGIGELAFQAQTAPIPLLTPSFRGLIFSIILSDSPAHIFAVQNHLPITESTDQYFWIARPENRKFYPEKKLFKRGLCPITTGYGQKETLSCLIDYDLQRSGRVKAWPFGCCAALTRPDPADMIQTSKQSLSAAQLLSPYRHILWLLFVELIWGNFSTESQKNFRSDATFTE